MNKVMNNILASLQKENERQKRLIATPEYMEWLYLYTEANPQFNDMTLAYRQDCPDYDKLSLLTHFFDAIEAYCQKNMLNVNVDCYGRWYNIKYKNVYFSVGVYSAQGSFNFVTRYDSFEPIANEYLVAFDNIMNNVQDENLEAKKNKLAELKKLMKEAKALDIPDGEVLRIFNSVFKENK